MADRITVLTTHGRRVEADCLPTPVPGLAINQSPTASGWNVTHRRTGAALFVGLPSPGQALDLAIALGRVTDWTASGPALRADPAVEAGWRRVVDAEAAWLYTRSGARITDAELAEAGAS